MLDRKHYIDNIRWLTILFLFPFHALIIYNNFGEDNYIKGTGNIILSNITTAIWPWFMPVLFVLAGISTVYALKKKTIKGYIIERIKKLFVPLVFGVLLICPILTYYAELYHNGYSGTYIQQYILFFTKETDLTGYTGGFTPGHLWFILYLFIVSLISLPIVYFAASKINSIIEKMNIVILLLLFIIPLFGQFIANINGKSIGEYFCYYLIGYFVLSNDKITDKCIRYRRLLGILSMICVLVYLILLNFSRANDIVSVLGRFYGFCSTLFILGIGKMKLNFSNRVTIYLSKISFGIYLFHLPWVIIIAYYAMKFIQNIYIQAILITLLSVPFTIVSTEILRRISITRFMFGLKKSSSGLSGGC
jgi:peptidoglycan/LPS O-acetylase OafA/YrhL